MRIALLILVAFSAPAAVAPDPDAGIECVLRELSAISGLEARFEEERRLTLLPEPLLSRGSLFYAAPDSLLRRVDAPVPSRTLVRANELFIDGPNGTRSMQLQQHAGVRVFVETFRGLLAGNLTGLRRIHAVEYQGDAAGCQAWKLRLTPLRAGPVREIRVTGSGRRVEALSIHARSGNQTTIRFSEVDVGRSFDAEERARLFDVPAP